MGVGWESETQDLPLPRDCPLPTAGIWGRTFQKSLALLPDGSLCGQRRELTDGLWIRAYDKVTEGGFVLKCLLLNISMKARHVPVACNQIADSPSLPFPAIPARVTGTGGESSALPRLDRDALGLGIPGRGRNSPCFPQQEQPCGSRAGSDTAGAGLAPCSANVTAPLGPGSSGTHGRLRRGQAVPASAGMCGQRSCRVRQGGCGRPAAPGEPQLSFPSPVPEAAESPHPSAEAGPKGHRATSAQGVRSTLTPIGAPPQPSGSCKRPIWCQAGWFQPCETLDSAAGRAHCRGTVRNRHESEAEI